MSGRSVDHSCQAKFSSQHFVSIARTAAHSSFVKSILKLLRHLPPATIEKSLCVAKLACSSLAAFTFLTFSSRALKKEKLFGMLFKSAHTQRSSLSSRTFFPIIRSRCERQKEKYKSVKASEANNGRHQTLTFTQECLRGCDARGCQKRPPSQVHRRSEAVT